LIGGGEGKLIERRRLRNRDWLRVLDRRCDWRGMVRPVGLIIQFNRLASTSPQQTWTDRPTIAKPVGHALAPPFQLKDLVLELIGQDLQRPQLPSVLVNIGSMAIQAVAMTLEAVDSILVPLLVAVDEVGDRLGQFSYCRRRDLLVLVELPFNAIRLLERSEG
jgi:hypothetical protein